jgi:hypothetical protein
MDIHDKSADTGLSRTVKHLKDITSIIGEVNKVASAALAPFKMLGKGIAAPFKLLNSALNAAEVRIGQFNLATIADHMRDLSQQTGTLSDEIDSAFASNVKAVKPMFAALGKTGKELRNLTGRASSMAYAMNVSADTVGKVMSELESAAGPAKAGLDALNMSTKDFVKLVEAGGPETAMLSDTLGDLQTFWDMSAKGAASTVDAMLAYGQAVGIGSQGLMQLNPLMEKMNAAMVDAPPNMRLSADEMQNLLISSTKLAGAYRTMGATQEQAMEASQQTSELFVKESMAYQKALTQGGEYGEMSKKLMSVLGAWGVSWQDFGGILREGATDSTKGMMRLQDIVQTASLKGFGPADILMRQLLGTIGETSPAMGWLAQNVTAGRDALQQFDAMSVQSEGALRRLAKEGFTTGLTLQEQFDRGRQAMEHMVRRISGKEVQGYVQTQVQGYREMGKTIQDMGDDKTWGPVIKKLSILKRGGLQGVLMSMAGSKEQQKVMGKTFAGMELAAGAIEDVSKAAAPLMSTLGKFGPLGTLAGGLATWFAIPKDARNKMLADLKPVFEGIKGKVKEIWYGSEAEGMGLKAKLQTVWEEDVKPFFQENVPKLLGFVGDILKTVGSEILDMLTSPFRSFGQSVKDSIDTGLAFALSGVKYLGDSISGFFGGIWAKIKLGFYGLTQGFLTTIQGIPLLGKALKVAGIDMGAVQGNLSQEIAALQADIADRERRPAANALRGLHQMGVIPTQKGAPLPAEQPLAPGRVNYYTPAAVSPVQATQQTLTSMQSLVTDSKLPETAVSLGAQMTSGLSQGILGGQTEVTDSLNYVLGDARLYLQANSPPVKGPLSGTDADNPAYNGGYGMMELFAMGIYDGGFTMQSALETALLDSFDAAYGIYEEHAAERIKGSTVMAQVADQLVRELGGLARVDLSAQETQVLQTSIDVPGMAGVSAAIIADGNLTRKVLGRIADSTEGMYKLMQKGTAARPGQLATAPV